MRLGIGALVLLLALPAAGQAPSSGLEAAARQLANGDLEGAEEALRALLAREPSVEASDLLGVVLARQGRLVEAEQQFLEVVESAPEYPPARRNLGRLYLDLRRPADALRELATADRLEPLGRQLALRLAGLELEAGEVESAERRLREVAERHESVRALLMLARSLARRGQNQSALAPLEEARRLAPNAEDVLSAHARVLLAVKAPVPAIDTLRALERMHPGEADYPYLLGVAQLQIAESTSGIESIQRSLEIEPGKPLAFVALGLAFKEQKRFAEAREALQQALRRLPGNVDALIALAEAEEGLGELQGAERHVERALELSREAPEALFVLGKIRMSQGRYEEARDLLEGSVAEGPAPGKAHYQLSLAYARLGDREASRRHLELYREATVREEEQLIELRTAAGLGVGGMRRGG